MGLLSADIRASGNGASGRRFVAKDIFYDNGPNGSPTRLLNLNEQPAWSAEYNGWGEIVRVHVDQVDNPRRLQGQYEDYESQLFYNLHRYYIAGTGQFASQDPLGLLGGTNLYAYAPNIWSWIDPLGLLCQYLRKRLRAIEELAENAGNSGLRTALTPRQLRQLGEAFVGEGYTVARGRNGELWLISQDGKRLFRSPTTKSSDFARTGKQANFHQRSNTNQNWFDEGSVSNVHVHSK